ncbi:helix-turn-helix domain-containing protein [Pelagibacterium flavum]|uniref:Helix-turn-helix domain-containing protein n=1 Tax=Pelagibacterium flavum TaxID=2984530 RepID=A0ABY6IJP8_9HYPH|nr:helix-turn-helix domain-containing protein [Pelagibacterium sp. YIM 151497]UYQ70833.1 helix-turn-helix domain-containing protein [Pelagibacterium sp. YIM 151497]
MRPMAYSVSDVIEMIGIGRTKFYQLVSAGEIKTRKIGNRTVVLAADLDTWLASLPSSTNQEVNQ